MTIGKDIPPFPQFHHSHSFTLPFIPFGMSTRQAVMRSVTQRIESVHITSALPEGVFSRKIIGTHSGRFHCDEALACGLLLHTPVYEQSHIIRTRNPALLEKADVVVDVGGVYDHSTARYDHHQPTFRLKMETPRASYTATRLSSAGLIYLHYGRALIKEFCQQFAPDSAEFIDVLYDKLYKDFIEHVDAIDNGVEQCSGVFEKLYHIPNTLASRIDSLNPRWNEEISDEIANCAFQKAILLATGEFYARLEFLCMSWIPARRLVVQAFEDAQKSKMPEVIIISGGGLPWKEHLFDVEKEKDLVGKTLYCMFPEVTGEWKIIAVPEKLGGFANRLPLPWKGLRDDELDKASGISGCIFVHASGFIGGNRTFEGAFEMAQRSMAVQRK
ncbi:UPF0160 protein MYG1 mitochondrial [Perkinsela sp. CCAP 1560/4]|nr:UPF0160 protein MYG1 mitochondrial [Perkinsela sp. CCAP 1560/4]|eukprot:KNH06456.1 UPF0160 protein MYG1 mitochondrial [Perkinsela sp. CCAP 1560/4]